MKAITLHILSNIKDGFKRFLKADKMQELIKDNSAEMIAIQILRRIKSNVEALHLDELAFD